MIGSLVFSVSLCFYGSTAFAHPVPRSQHDRTIAVQITPDLAKKEVAVNVRYRLEVDELTVILDDMAPFLDEAPFARFKNKPLEFYAEFTRIYAPILARNLIASVDGKPLVFQCTARDQRLTDDDGTKLGHLRCDFTFASTFPLRYSEEQTISFREGNYVLQLGQIKLTWDFVPHKARSTPGGGDMFIGADWVALVKNAKAPSPALQAKSPLQQEPGDDDMLRELVLPISWGSPAAPPASSGSFDLLSVYLASDQGIVVVLLLSVVVGAAHALTPGHGKTLVAAYLVGQRGTVGHALILGLVTTITHTGIVLLIGLGLLFVDEESRQAVAQSLGLGMGIALVCLGAWLLLQRLAGRADHFHLPGHSHHHGPSGEVVAARPRAPLTWTGLIVMGMTGGIAPCWDAVAMLVLAIGMNLLWLALPMLLAFSAGLASVLVLIGILVVHARKLVDARWSDSRLIRFLPIASALFITAMGVLICYQGVQGEFHSHATEQVAVARP